MGKIYHSVTELIGSTPLLEAKNFIAENQLPATVLVKLEYFNPAGSVKDRIAKAMIEQAEKEGKLKPDSDKRQYRHWTCKRCCSKRLSCDPHNAGDNER